MWKEGLDPENNEKNTTKKGNLQGENNDFKIVV